MPVCLNCNTNLLKKVTEFGQIEYCPNCESKLIGIVNVKRSNVKIDVYHHLWTHAKQDADRSGRECPLCNDKTSLQELQIDDEILNVEICTHCHQFWFDPGEFEKMPREEVEELIAEDDPEVKKILSNYERITKAEQKKIRYNASSLVPKSFWEYIAGIFGFPIEEDGSLFEFYPFITWLVTIICFVMFFITAGDLNDLVLQLGFIPAQWSRYFGLTAITSMLMHGSFWHLIGNMYFLLAFGDNVEDHLGRSKFLLLLIGSHLMGLLLHGMFSPTAEIPLIGASAAVSGVMAFYAVTFPQKRVIIVWMIYFRFLRFRLKVRTYFFFWCLLQGWIIYQQLGGSGSVSGLGHLGGVLIGFGFAAYLKAGEN